MKKFNRKEVKILGLISMTEDGRRMTDIQCLIKNEIVIYNSQIQDA